MDRSGHQGIEETAAQPSCSFLTSGDAQRRSGVDSPDPATASPPAPCPRCSGRRGRASPLGVDRLASSTIGVVGQPGPTCRLLGAVELGRQRPGDREHRGPVDQHRPLAPAPTRQIRGVSRGPRSTAGRSRPRSPPRFVVRPARCARCAPGTTRWCCIRPCSRVEVDARPLRRRARQAWSRRSIRRRRIVSLLAGRLPARR
jgi:hypothetical protein